MTAEVYGFFDEVPPDHRIPLVFNPILIEDDQLLLPPYEWEDGALMSWGKTLLIVKGVEFEGTKVVRQKAQPDYCLYVPPYRIASEYIHIADATKKIEQFTKQAMDAGDGYLRAALTFYEDASSAGQTPEAFARMLLMPLSRKRRKRILKSLKQVATLDPSVYIGAALKEVFDRR